MRRIWVLFSMILVRGIRGIGRLSGVIEGVVFEWIYVEIVELGDDSVFALVFRLLLVYFIFARR